MIDGRGRPCLIAVRNDNAPASAQQGIGRCRAGRRSVESRRAEGFLCLVRREEGRVGNTEKCEARKQASRHRERLQTRYWEEGG
jgi:hypothetical protein